MMFTSLRCLNNYNDLDTCIRVYLFVKDMLSRMTSTKLNKCREFPECNVYDANATCLRTIGEKMMTKNFF